MGRYKPRWRVEQLSLGLDLGLLFLGNLSLILSGVLEGGARLRGNGVRGARLRGGGVCGASLRGGGVRCTCLRGGGVGLSCCIRDVCQLSRILNFQLEIS